MTRISAADARGIAVVLGIFLGTRLVVWTATYAGSFYHFRIENQIRPPMVAQVRILNELPAEERAALLRAADARLNYFAPLLTWDARHYREIVERGYRPPAPATQPGGRPKYDREIAFFPLYPLICAALKPLLGVPLAMVTVTHLCCLLAAWVVYSWIARRSDRETAIRAVAFMLCWPAACFYSFGYAESLTLLLVALTCMLADRNRFALAAVCSGLATGTRPTALAVAPVLALTGWVRTTPIRRQVLVTLGVLLVGTLGLAAYAVYLRVLTGSWTAYFENFREGWVGDTVRADWFQYVTFARVWDQFKYFGRMLRDWPVGVLELMNPQTWNMPCNFAMLILSIAGLRVMDRSFRPFLALGPLIFLHAYLASGGATFGVEPIARYTAVAAPAYVVLAVCTRRMHYSITVVLVAGMILVQAAWAFAFGSFEWSG